MLNGGILSATSERAFLARVVPENNERRRFHLLRQRGGGLQYRSHSANALAQLDTRSFKIAGVHLMKIRWTFIRIGKTGNVDWKIPTAQRMQARVDPHSQYTRQSADAFQQLTDEGRAARRGGYRCALKGSRIIKRSLISTASGALYSRSRVWRNNPAPDKRIIARLSSAVTRAPRSQPIRFDPPLVRPDSFSGLASSPRAVCKAGASPNSSVVSRQSAKLNRSTGQLRTTSASSGITPCGTTARIGF